MVEDTPFEAIPAYLRAVTILQPEGNPAAEITDVIRRWQKPGTPAVADRGHVFRGIASLLSVVLGGLLIATALGTAFSYSYPTVDVDTGLATLILLVGMALALGIRWFWHRMMRVRP
jgi:hypothetical protein